MTTAANFSPMLRLALGMFIARRTCDRPMALRDAMVAVFTDQEHLREAARKRGLSMTTLHRAVKDFRARIKLVCEEEGFDPHQFIVPHDQIEPDEEPAAP